MAWLSTWCVNNQPRYAAHDTETAAIEHAKTMRAGGWSATHFWSEASEETAP